jgi:hypothetical protein
MEKRYIQHQVVSGGCRETGSSQWLGSKDTSLIHFMPGMGWVLGNGGGGSGRNR